ncbi:MULTISPECIES: beta-ketoacyl-ACP synthase II [Chloracidobacterium]|jgi:3-oxoacyl-[acyl-carrier-protein] synthase II|uniref:3-oxoacyl-[acyl-carrier-protein] synthase 2 n=1 Tax=Chloracidobacterium thermophilum (strain B) TaxID=981222 RepID=G2LIU7_CHLTF|nr:MULTISPECIES: beta-ketoacyl-ACP synthase II [Chloracidobacterium]AEP12315.1 3-oxoacyl-[acyl-carrier-protein] synthase II [Chloracidobacterium thermophilum B]QUV78064.1 beta-ketoacyl-ACP synthase II [Chloracidobacterium thermophilum]QUV81119.1 beta-ketoacyl-ACP synthase II [Chloracidobacterium sp. D]
MKRRVVVTGVGVVSPLGLDVPATWEALLAGTSGIGPITRFDATAFAVRIAGEVRGFDPAAFIEKKEIKKMDPFIHYAIAAAEEAMRDSGLHINGDHAARVGVHIGSALGGLTIIEREHTKLHREGPHRVSPFFIPSAIINLASGQISIRFGAKGPNLASATACASGAHAIGESFRIIQAGDADVMLCGGAEAPVTPTGIGGFAAMRALSTRNAEPARASRPFDRQRDGFVMGEGAAVLVLEEREQALARGKRPLAEVVGFGQSADAFHLTHPSEVGDGAARAMRQALADAGIAPAEVGYLNAHATGTPAGDAAEAAAIHQVFGAAATSLAVSSTKSMTGHLLGAAGALEAVVAVLALRDGRIPPTINLDEPEFDLDCVPCKAREMSLDYAMSNAFGFGGVNVSLVFRRAEA